MWVVKAKGESYYVEHVACEVPWSTKETPDNSHTKGSIKIKRCKITIDDDNCASITELTVEDEQRLSGGKKPIRIITQWGKRLKEYLLNYEHGDVKTAGGGCGTLWFITDIYNEADLMFLKLAIQDLRVLKPNEDYYKMYDGTDDDHIDEDDFDWEDLYED
ncbi:MAG: hypothetical protein EBT51_10940 [Flavobacteriaceae bacterium]|nr:hypothetical protein [Flavobacteriaceae bacterium]